MVIPAQPPAPWAYPYPQNLTDFQPRARIVTQFTAILPYTIEVTTQTPHEYLSNLVVKFFTKLGFTLPQLFDKTFLITVTSPTQFTIQFRDPFTFTFPALTTTPQPMQVMPIAEVGQSLASAINNDA